MKLLRNPEVYSSVIIISIVSAAAVLGAYFAFNKAWIYVLCVCGVLLTIHFATVYRRYKRIAALSADIDRILHGEENIFLECFSEGELAVLQSEIYKMTVRLREQQQKLQNEKIYLADFLADISHQIRTPLTSINLIVTMLSQKDITPEKRVQLVQKLNGLLTRIDWLITALLKMSKIDAGTGVFKTERISLGKFIKQACMPVQIPIEIRGQQLDAEAQGEFTGDIEWSCEAVGNIVKNCMEHTPEGGVITIKAAENALYTEILISDSGKGIAPEDLPHIFERFYKGRASEDKGGFGIGLALARMIITSQNGTVKAYNSAAGGACFEIRFYKGIV